MRTPFKDYLEQGKSNNYLHSEVMGKLKAGEAALVLSKKFKTKVYAKELHVFSSEWHHAGIFKGSRGKLGGRHVYFLTQEEVNKIDLEEILAHRKAAAEKALTADEPVQGWYVEFVKGPKNRYGKRSWMPLMGLYKGPRGNAPKTFKALDQPAFEDARKFQGKQLKPYANQYDELAEGPARPITKPTPAKPRGPGGRV